MSNSVLQHTARLCRAVPSRRLALQHASREPFKATLKARTPATPAGVGAFARKPTSQHLTLSRRQLGIVAMASAAASAPPKFDVYVKGTPAEGNESDKGELGDCPFSQRVLLTLEEKGIPYHKVFINEYDMPDWIGEKNQIGKKIPVVKDLEADKWIGDSGEIVKYVEQKFPDPSLGTPESTSDVGEGIMPAFVEFLKADPPAKKEEEGLVKELRQFDEFLQKQGGPYIAGDHLCAQCVAVAPRLYHTKVALKNIKGWEIPSEFKALHSFMDAMQQRKSWKNTAPTEQYVTDGWKKKLESM